MQRLPRRVTRCSTRSHGRPGRQVLACRRVRAPRLLCTPQSAGPGRQRPQPRTLPQRRQDRRPGTGCSARRRRALQPLRRCRPGAAPTAALRRGPRWQPSCACDLLCEVSASGQEWQVAGKSVPMARCLIAFSACSSCGLSPSLRLRSASTHASSEAAAIASAVGRQSGARRHVT